MENKFFNHESSARMRHKKVSQLIQCLLFVVQDGSADSSEASIARRRKPIQAYVLLPSVISVNNPVICELFTKRCNIQLLCNEECPTLRLALERGQVEIIELILLNDAKAYASKSKTLSRLQFSVDGSNEGVVRRIFGRNAVLSETQFNSGRILNAVDVENKNILNQILSVKPHIRLRDLNNSTLLHLAVAKGDGILVKMLLGYGISVNATRNESTTPLHLATQYRNLQMVKLLLEKGASVNARQKNGATCLYLAAEGGCLEILKFVVSCGGSLSIGKFDGTKPLHAAAKNGHIEVLKDLLQRGININTCVVRGRMKGCTPLYFAAEEGRTVTVKCLADLGADVNAVNHEGESALHAALDKKCAETVRCILSYRPNLNGRNSKKEVVWLDELIIEKTNKFEDIIKFLVQRGFTVCSQSVRNRKLLLRAISKNDLGVVRMLLGMGVRINEVYPPVWYHYGQYSRHRSMRYPETSLLHAAVAQSRDTIVQLLLEHGADVNLKCQEKHSEVTPLDVAIVKSDLKLVNVLLTNGAAVRSDAISKASVIADLEIIKILLLNAKDLPAQTLHWPLLRAVYGNNLELVKVLLSFGAEVNFKSRHSLTPLEVAVNNSNLELVKVLLTSGVVVSSGAISKASVVPNVDIIKTLLLSAVDLPAKTLNSALLRAASKGNLEVVKVLLSSGANVNFNSHEECPEATPLEAAVDNSNLELVKVLLTNGAFVRSDAISKASVCRTAEIMKTLLLNSMDIPAKTLNSALLRAASKGNLEVVKVLLKFGAVLDAERSPDGSSAVHYACEFGCDMAKFFIANNANLEVRDEAGKTPLFRAAQKSLTVVDLLLMFGTRIDIVDNNGKSALLHVVTNSSSSRLIFESLLNANFQAPDLIVKTNVWKIFVASNFRDDQLFHQRRLWNIHNFEECSEIFERLIIKVKAANIDFNAEKIILSWPLSNADDFRSDCESEIACMKTQTIGETFVTFYEILTKDAQKLAGYMRNDTIHQMLKSSDYKTRFPNYASIIELQIKKGTQRRELLDEGLKICRHLFGKFLSLPLELRERIVNCLTDQNLLVLKYAFTGSVS